MKFRESFEKKSLIVMEEERNEEKSKEKEEEEGEREEGRRKGEEQKGRGGGGDGKSIEGEMRCNMTSVSQSEFISISGRNMNTSIE